MQEQNQFPKRKRNRLYGYDYSSPGMYFLTICTKNKEKRFGEVIENAENQTSVMRLTDIGIIINEQIQSINRAAHIELVNYVVMPNHIHILLFVDTFEHTSGNPENAIIPKTVSGFKRLCHKRIGYDVFQRNYHDHIVRDQHHFEIIWNYIEDNPRRWKEDIFFIPE